MQCNCISYINAHSGQYALWQPYSLWFSGRAALFSLCCHAEKLLCNHWTASVLQNTWHMPDRIRMHFMQACCYQLAVYHILLPSKPSGSHLIRWSTEICWLAREEKWWFVLTATQSEVSACDQISGNCVMNHILRHLGGCCLGLWK